MEPIDRSKRIVKRHGFRFQPFRPKGKHEVRLADAGLDQRVELLLFERQGRRRALLLPEIAYHHVCQGELAGQPYLISF